MIDNLIHSFANDIQNGIPILPFYGDKKDEELLYLTEVMKGLRSFMNCKGFVQDKFRVKEFYAHLSKAAH